MKIKILLIILLLGNGCISNAKSTRPEQLFEKIMKAGISNISKADCSDISAKASGKIKIQKYKNGNYYVGEWAKGKPNGYGKKAYSDKSSYIGYWKDGMFEDQGTLVYFNGSKYTGNWNRGLRHGKGKITLSYGDWYDGEWKEGIMVGEGEAKTLSDNKTYKGSFSIETKNEKFLIKPKSGKISTPSMSQEGVWYGNAFKGVYRDNDKEFEGSMAADDFVKGELRYKDKEKGKHSGTFKAGKIYSGTSEGLIDKTYLCDNPAKYMGEWKNGKFIGKFEGKEYGPNTRAFALNSNSEEEIYGIVQRTDGGVYLGSFKDKKLCGEGKLMYPDHEYSGLWKDGQWIEGTAEIKRENQNPLKITYNGQQFLVDDPENRLTGVYNVQSFDFSSPIAEIENMYNKKRKEEQERKEKEERKKFADYFDANYAGLVFEAEDIISYVNEGYGMFGSMMGMEVGIVVSLRKGGIANLTLSINSSSSGFTGLLLGSLISGGGESMTLYPSNKPNVFFTDSSKDYSETLIVSLDKSSALLYLSKDKIVKLKRRY